MDTNDHRGCRRVSNHGVFAMRSVPEWIGRNDDSPVPPRVRRRVFDTWGGRCYLSHREIRPGDVWQLEDIKAICNGGQNRESNKAPVLVEPHKIKSKADVKIKAKTARMRNKHLGLVKSPHPMRNPKFRKTMSGKVVLR